MLVSDVSSATIFGISFLGALFAILAAMLLTYTYVTLRLVPRLTRSFRALVEEIGPKALFERANLDPAETMRQLGISPTEAVAAHAKQQLRADPPPGDSPPVRVVYTCEDHGRCGGCPKVLAQFEAIVTHQGEASFDEIERRCFAQLKDQLASDALIEGEAEADRQRRLAARVIEALVREGFAIGYVRGVVWAIGKDDRATYAGWLAVARTACAHRIGMADKKIEESVS
jgi:hypothetical protein